MTECPKGSELVVAEWQDIPSDRDFKHTDTCLWVFSSPYNSGFLSGSYVLPAEMSRCSRREAIVDRILRGLCPLLLPDERGRILEEFGA